MNFDKLLTDHIGEFGKYQLIYLILVVTPTIFTSFSALSWTFAGATGSFECINHGTFNNTLDTEIAVATCGGSSWIKNRRQNLTISDDEFCHDFEWDRSIVGYTATERWKLICNRQWLKALIQSHYYVGQFFGSIIFGILGDHIGRKKTLIISLIILLSCESCMSIVPWWPLFAFLLFCCGAAHPGIYVNAVVLAVEIVSPKHRLYASAYAGTLFSIGVMILGLLAWFIRHYQILLMSISLPITICLSYLWKLPESPRWLLSRKRIQEAVAIMRRIAEGNRRKFPLDLMQNLEIEGQEAKKYTIFDLFKTTKIRQRMLLMFVCWPNAAMCYYGLSMNPTLLGGDKYFTFILAGFIEISAIFIVLLLVDRIGRKIMVFSGFLLTACVMLAAFFIPEDQKILLIGTVITGKLTIKAAYNTLYLYTPELFPTLIRSTAVGLCSMVARFGATIASFLAMWLADINPMLVISIFVLGSFLSAFCVLFLPETKGQPQPESIDEIENNSNEKRRKTILVSKSSKCTVWRF